MNKEQTAMRAALKAVLGNDSETIQPGDVDILLTFANGLYISEETRAAVLNAAQLVAAEIARAADCGQGEPE